MNETTPAQLRRLLHGLKKPELLERYSDFFTESQRKRTKFELIEMLVKNNAPFLDSRLST